MTEVYPSDSELLNLVHDEATGVEYITTGKSPYYLEFRKLLYRLLLACRAANNLRLYDAGGLSVGVKAGKFWLGNTLIDFAGVGPESLADDKENIYVYINAEGNLVTDEYSGFPDMAQQPHLRLAIVTTGSGDITSIADCRHNFTIPFGAGGVKRTIVSHTADGDLSESQSGSVHTNLAATGTVVLTLPSAAAAGTVFSFAVQSACQLRIEPGAAAIIDDSGQTAGKYKCADTVGAAIELIADENGNWAVIAKNGTWTQEA